MLRKQSVWKFPKALLTLTREIFRAGSSVSFLHGSLSKQIIYVMKRAFTVSIMILAMSSILGAQTNEKRSLDGFTSVSLGIPGDLFIKIGPAYSVELSGNSDEIANTITDLSSGRLIIKRRDNRYFGRDRRITINITMPGIEGLSVSGSGKAEITDAVEADELSFAVSGSGNLIADRVEADKINCSISGSGNIRINGDGSADSGDIKISGSGNYSGSSLRIDKLDVTVSGSGSCLCSAGDELEAVVSGSGNIVYRGNPKIDARVSGSGRVRSE